MATSTEEAHKEARMDYATRLRNKEAWIVEYMHRHNVGREAAEKKYRSMRRHGLV